MMFLNLSLSVFNMRLMFSCFLSFNTVFFFVNPQEVSLEEIKKELLARPTEKLVEDLRKKVKILQVMYPLL